MTRAVRGQASSATSWVRCPRCQEMAYRHRFVRDQSVCPGCGWHAPLTAMERRDQILDRGSATDTLVAAPTLADPLGFVDSQPYVERLRHAGGRTGLPSAVLCTQGTVRGHRVVLAAMDFRFMGGSMGAAEGEQIAAAADTALARRVPLLLVTASGGARMQEGVLSLLQMAKTAQAMARLDEAGVLTIGLVTDPTYGGVAASFATLPDVIVAEPGARLGFAGPRVIEQTLGQRLPEGFQTAEFLVQAGLIDHVWPRPMLRHGLGQVLAAGTAGRPGRDALRPPLHTEPVVTDPDRLPELDAWQAVRLARDPARPTTLDYADRILEGFVELHGDRVSGDCPATVGGIGFFDDVPIMLIGHQKGHSTSELADRNFGMPMPEGNRKAARLMRLAAKLGLPVVTLVDTPGAHPGVAAEEHGQALAIAENLRLMSGLPVPIVTVVLGEGGSGGALALSVADRVLMAANSVYSVISPEGCAAILWRHRAEAPRAARALRLTARDLLALGVVDGVVPEPSGGTQADSAAAAALLSDALRATLPDLLATSSTELVQQRRSRYRLAGLDLGPDRKVGV